MLVPEQVFRANICGEKIGLSPVVFYLP